MLDQNMLSIKTNLEEFQKTEIITSIFSDLNGMKPEVNYKKKTEEYTNKQKLNTVPLNSQWFTEEIKKYMEII